MAIVKKRPKTQHFSPQMSEPHLPSLLIPTEFHPNGRVQLDPVTRMVRMPARNILYKTKVKVHGMEREIEVNGGHAKADGSVWRIALAGPTRYFWKFLRDELAYKLRGSHSISAPMLTDEEIMEARQFVAYLLKMKEEGTSVLPGDFLNKKYDNGLREQFAGIDKQFYAWLKKQDLKMEELPSIQAVFAFLPA